VDEAREEARKRKLLTHDAAMPQPSDPPPPEIPFLKPIGHPPLGASIDATI
jgi:hypothetical protein